jgi:hypothetical protein
MRLCSIFVLIGSCLLAVLWECSPVPAWSGRRTEAVARTAARDPGRASMVTDAWALDPAGRLFTVAGRDAGPYAPPASPSSLPAPATERETVPTEVLALPDNAFAVKGDVWYRVDRRGVMAPLPGWQRLRELKADETRVAAAPDGSLIVAADVDVGPSRIVRLSPDGQLTTVIDGRGASALAVRPDGAILAADDFGHRIVLIRDGVVTPVAGTGRDGAPNGESGPATDAIVSDAEQLSALADDSFVYVDGYDNAVIRHVDADGIVTTIAGGGAIDTSSRCLDHPVPARAVQLRSPRTIALPDGSILIDTEGGTYQLSSDGQFVPVACVVSPTSLPAPSDVYWDGSLARRPRVAVGRAMAVTSDGGVLIASDRHVALVPPIGGGQRLAAALPAANLYSVPHGRLIVALTRAAGVSLTVRRRDSGRVVERVRASLSARRSDLTLPHRLAAGEFRLDLTAHSPDGGVAVDSLAVFGRRRLELPAARRALSWRPIVEGNLGRASCRRRSTLRARCRARAYWVGEVPEGRCVIDVRLRPDGRLEAHEPHTDCVEDRGLPYIVDPH